MAAHAPLRFSMLGSLRVWNGTAWSTIRASQQRVVLAVLLVEAGRVVTAERLVEEIWGDDPPRSALRTVHGYVFRLRRVLACGPAGPLLTRNHGYEMRLADGDLDTDAFERMTAAGRASLADNRLDAAVAQLSEALGLWRGPALADVPASPTVTAQAGKLEQHRLAAVEERLGALLDLGRPADVVAELQALVAAHPLRERLWAQLMLALSRSGQRGEALDAYRRARDLLVAELGLEPGPAMRQVQQAILSDDAEVSPFPGLDMPVPHAITAIPAQLPADVSSFAGRQEQLKRLDTLLRGDGERSTAVVISTIAGTAGVGKTALAVHWAHHVRDHFPDGQLYVNLRGYATGAPLRPIDALAMFLPALGMAAEQIPTEVDQAASLYRSLLADKRILILLDNANHPDQVRPLLPAGPACLALVTSRDQLRGLTAIDGATRINLDLLTPGEALTLLARLLGPERVEAEATAAADLARLCGYLPLAVRIAAGNVTAHPGTTIAGYAADLAAADRLLALQVEGDPHAGVRAAFDHSYTALSTPDRHLFRLLSLIPGPDLAAPAAAALTDTDAIGAAQQLDRLGTAHLIEEHTPGRYIMHDLIRLYATEQTNTEDSPSHRQAALSRLYEHYLHSIAAAAGPLYPSVLRLPLPAAGRAAAALSFGDHGQARAWLDAERPNLVAAVQHAAAHGPAWAGWRLADALRGHLDRRAYTVDWQTVARAGLAAAEADGDQQAQAAAHLSLATLHAFHDRYPQATDHFRLAIALARQTGWAQGESAALGNLGGVYSSLGRIREASDHISQALAIDRKSDWRAGQAIKLINLGLLHESLGQLEPAVDYYQQALALSRRQESRSVEAVSLRGLGQIYHLMGRFEEALATLTQALALRREVGDRKTEGDNLSALAAVHRDAGRCREAVDLAGTALVIARDNGDRRLEAFALSTQASVHHHLGHLPQAIAGHERAVHLARDIGNRHTEAAALVGLAAARQHAGDLANATLHVQHALTIARDCEYRLLEGNALTALASIQLSRTPAGQAIANAEQALAVHRETGHRLGEAHTHLIAHHALRSVGREPEALRHHHLADVLFDEIGAPRAQHARAVLGGPPAPQRPGV